MLDQLKDFYHVRQHEGLETLGKCLGARTTRTTEHGAPDVIWSFESVLQIAIEAKTEKKADGRLSKRDLVEAGAHPLWVQANQEAEDPGAEIATIVVAPSRSLHPLALPFATGGLFYVAPDRMLSVAKAVAEGVRKLRVTFSGREFPEAAREFCAEMRSAHLDIESVRKTLLSDPLKE